MSKNLVIVESPAKAKTIEKFLGKDFKVLSSFGHIRDLKKKDFSIDVNDGFKPIYEIPTDKKKVVSDLLQAASDAEVVWLASDEDREGEAIAWHLYETLKLSPEKTKRIVFHEITPKAILSAIETPRSIDVNLVNAQQARRVLDRIVGFELSPVLWKKVKPALSAGRVQSVTVKLIAEREREIQAFTPEEFYRVTADFFVFDSLGRAVGVKAELNRRFSRRDEAHEFLQKCSQAHFSVEDVVKRPLAKSPAPPFTTSTLQQEAARKIGLSVAQTMRIAQKLYESGYITYMRTDSFNLSTFAIEGAKNEILSTMGEQYLHIKKYKTKAKGAQEAHEAIRPSYFDKRTVDGTSQEKRLYELIWKRTVASQMSDAQIEKTTATIGVSGADSKFLITGEVIVFDGFLKLYIESSDEEKEGEDTTGALPVMNKGAELTMNEIQATQRYTQLPSRYSEAMLVRKLEELGIGRPSTYAPTISTIQQREYVVKGEREGNSREYIQMILTSLDGIKELVKIEMYGSEKGKLLPTDIGLVVNDFLQGSFPQIMDYQFTATVEKEFDQIAEGNLDWSGSLSKFYSVFHPIVSEVSAEKSELKVGERVLGIDPKSGQPVSVKIGRFGPMVQLGSTHTDEKPQFASLLKSESMETITLEEALKHFDLPKKLGEYEGKEVIVAVGKFGPYVKWNGSFVSLPKTLSPMEIDLSESIVLIQEKEKIDSQRQIKLFENDSEMSILNGRFGPYISYKGKNYKIPRSKKPVELTYEECLEIINTSTTKTRKK